MDVIAKGLAEGLKVLANGCVNFGLEMLKDLNLFLDKYKQMGGCVLKEVASLKDLIIWWSPFLTVDYIFPVTTQGSCILLGVLYCACTFECKKGGGDKCTN